MTDSEKRLSHMPSSATLVPEAECPKLLKPAVGEKDCEYTAGCEKDDEFVSGRYKEDSLFAWMVVLAGCIQAMITLGASRAHGVYQEYYVIDEFAHMPTATVSWIGSVQNTTLNLCGVFVGILSQVYDTRIMCAAGSLVMGLAFILASFSTEVWQLVLTQGVMFGSAASFPYILGVTVPLQWIKKRRGLALALVYMGSGVGGMWISILTRSCIDTVGRAWSQRIIGCIVMVLGVGLSPLIASRRPTQRPQKLFDLSVLREWRFLFIAGSSFFAMAPNTIPYILLPTYTADVLKESSRLGSTLVTIINVSGIFGRFVAGVLSDRFGPVNMLIVWTLLAAYSQLGIWLPFANVPATIASATLFGVTGSSIVGMILNALSHQYGVTRITYISGLIYMSYSISSLVVVQTTSIMLDTVGHGVDYTWPIVYTGLLLVVAMVVLIVFRFKLSPKLALVV
ncbi:hypothetical protein LPJ61_000250 [Coemansia biformis]|uniref:MFS general substrate transporter n=1 Tax=Coemansia biformis TaxID=1286918 RepID=A0A9W7YGL4_9FUNG|nr:hypothetical protein LPJ61_000250 [Coemansia biformis]